MDTPAIDPHGNRYEDDVKDRAYQAWAFVCSRRPEQVSDLLASGDLGESVDVSSRTIRRWVQDGQWPERVSRDLRAIAPDLREQTIAELVLGALDAARYLRGVVDGRHVLPSKERVTSAIALLDRAGLSHTGTRADPINSLDVQSAGESSPLLDGMTIEQLMSVEASARTKS